ncbi:MAG: V/A-type H+/Na+-transporting ATPase subunit [Carnobacterium sp.]|uniref:V-type ATP synthase subunit I n=1 Tax=Carnobacterium TaxID=2747 RepID=UPI000551A2B4|nr:MULTISPECIES: V-type ATP synthase subunit I [Carnobacterium]MDN5371558.1 V/A-type H+/Na+-transporting ATPase subunit [Carnobacterium sp.]
MAIAKMKQMTLLAEQEKKDSLLKAVQELQKLEMVELSTLEDSEFLDYYSTDTAPQKRVEYEEKLKEIQATLNFLNQHISQPGMIAKLRKGREEYTLEELENHVFHSDLDHTIVELGKIEKRLVELDQMKKNLGEKEEFLRKWQNMTFNPNDLKTFQLMSGTVGSIASGNVENFEKEVESIENSYLEKIFHYKDEASYLVLVPKKLDSLMEEIFERFQLSRLSYPYKLTPLNELKVVLKEVSDLRKEEDKLKDTIKAFKEKAIDLQLGEEYYYNLVEREIGKTLLLNGSDLFILNGWLEEERIPELNSLLDEYVGKDGYVVIADEIKFKNYAKVPVVLKNNKLVKPFESITEMYSMPKYDDVDPTPFMMPFYFVFFGMMSADLGYGILLWAATLIGSKVFKFEKGMKNFVQLFHYLSYSVIAWGFIYGSFFGYDLPFQLLSITNDVITILILSVVFGFIQLVYGLLLNGGLKWRKQQRSSSYIDGTAWALILLGIGLLVINMVLWNNDLLQMISLVVIIANVIGIILVTMLASDNKVMGFGLGLYNIYGATNYVGDLVSYTRLMALGVSGGSIAVAFNSIVDIFPPVMKFTIGALLFIVLHALNIFLTYLSAYIHTIRLQYVEFFGKFYEGGGRSLNPFKTFEKHIYLKNRTNK